MKQYEVNIISKQQTNFIVKARSKKEAERKATERWKDGDEDILGAEWETIEETIVNEIID